MGGWWLLGWRNLLRRRHDSKMPLLLSWDRASTHVPVAPCGFRDPGLIPRRPELKSCLGILAVLQVEGRQLSLITVWELAKSPCKKFSSVFWRCLLSSVLPCLVRHWQKSCSSCYSRTQQEWLFHFSFYFIPLKRELWALWNVCLCAFLTAVISTVSWVTLKCSFSACLLPVELTDCAEWKALQCFVQIPLQKNQFRKSPGQLIKTDVWNLHGDAFFPKNRLLLYTHKHVPVSRFSRDISDKQFLPLSSM